MREFRAHHGELLAAGVTVAGVTLDTLESCRTWARRLRLPYPLLSDEARAAGEACHLIERVGIGPWKIEFFRRTTLLADTAGIVRRVWGEVKIRGHALEVLAAARDLGDPSAADGARAGT
jgi:peroxiredoxin Q/BCP